MRTYFDTVVLVGALLREHPRHSNCLALINNTSDPWSCAHALAEAFSTLTGSYKVPNSQAAELILGLKEAIQIAPLELIDYETALLESRQRAVMGAGIYDALHAAFARRVGAGCIATGNPSHFRHVAPDMEILVP